MPHPCEHTSSRTRRISLLNNLKEGGAAYVTRTRDPIITNDVLYQLS